jgi:RNA polymerase sigma factor (sigma-70 family)
MPPDRSIPTRRSLLSRLKSWDNQDSWREFFDTYWRLLYDFARQAGLDDGAAQDAVQETIICVAKQMRGFKYDPSVGSFKNWLLQITRRRVVDQMRQHYRSALAQTEPASEPTAPANPAGGWDTSEWDALWEREWRDHITRVAMDRVKRQVRPEQYQMFDFAVLHGWTALQVAEALGATVTQVYMARHRIGRLLKKEIRHLEKKMI